MIDPLRLLGFAFAGADLLFEVDRNGNVLFATGATSTLVNQADIVGRPGAELFKTGEGNRFTIMTRGMTAGARLGPLPMTTASGEKAMLSMCFLPQNDRISCTLVRPGPRGNLGTSDSKDAQTGLSDHDAFMTSIAQNAGSKGAVALVNVPGLSDVCEKMSATESDSLLTDIGVNLKNLGATIAARLSITSFGVVSDDPLAAKGLADAIQGAARDNGVEHLDIQEVLVSLKGRGLTQEQNMLALRHVVGRFTDGKVTSVPGSDLSEVFDQMVGETLARAQNFNNTVSDGSFDLAFEPIVDLKTGTASHYEALTRFQPGQSPADTIRFAEELGLADSFDLALLVKGLSLLEASRAINASIALNLSGRSITAPASFAMVAGLLAKKRALARRVLIEITETAEMTDLVAADKAIQVLRHMGFRVGIDDFGAGAASLQYLHALNVDFVKVDGALIQRMGKSQREDALLKSIVTTCTELKIATVAEWIDSNDKLKRCTDMGFTYGQGRQFGPSLSALPAISMNLSPRRMGTA